MLYPILISRNLKSTFQFFVLLIYKYSNLTVKCLHVGWLLQDNNIVLAILHKYIQLICRSTNRIISSIKLFSERSLNK